MKKTLLMIAVGFALTVPMLAIPTDAEAAGQQQQRTPRGEMVRQIVLKWGGFVQEAYHSDVHAWASYMGPVFAKASLDTLARASSARTFDEMNDAFLVDANGNSAQMNAINAISKVPVKARLLGDTANDLVFVPVTPCRIIDTRLAGGAIAANTVRSFDVTVLSDYSGQGGASGNCDGVGAAGSFAAAAINFTVVTPGGAGYITAFPFLGTQPLAATVNYTAGSIVGNFAVVKLDQGASANELSIYSFAQTHVVADIVGYYIMPQATPLDCVETTSSGVDIPAGSFGTQSTSACAAGYTVVGGGCSNSTFDGRVVTTRTFTSTHFCAFRNEGAGSMNSIAYARCCRTPGR